MSIESLSHKAFEITLGFTYPSNQPYISLEDKGSITDTLPPVLGKADEFSKACLDQSENSALTPYSAKPIKASFLDQTSRAVQCLARIISLFAICLFIAPIGIVYNGVRALIHYFTQTDKKDSENLQINSPALACLFDFLFFLRMLLFFITYKFVLKTNALRTVPDRKLSYYMLTAFTLLL